MGAAGLLGTAGTGTTAAGTRSSSSSTDSPLPSGHVRRERLGVEVIDRTSGDRRIYPSVEAVKREELSPGEYEVVEVTREEGTIVERSSRVTVTAADAAPTAEDGIELRANAISETVYEHYAPGGTATIIAGAVERTGGVDRRPAADVDLTLELEGPDGNTITTRSAQTGDDGNAQVEFDLGGVDNGSYTVQVESGATSSTATARFDVGPYVDVPFHWTGMTPGEETTIGVFSALGGDPQSGVTHEISIEKPDGSEETVDLQFGEGGVGLLSYTPGNSGSHRFESVESGASGETIGCAPLKALTPYFEIRDQFVGETVTWGAHVVENTEPVSNLDLDVTIEERFGDGGVVEEFSPTTNEFGQFTIDFQAPDGTDTDYEIDISAADGRDVFLFGDRVMFEETDESDAVDLSVSTEEFTLGPGGSTSAEVELLDGEEPVTGQTVTLLTTYTFDDVPAGKTEVETGADGTATTTIEVPATAPDGERFYVNAVVDYDGETYTESDSMSIERYEIDVGDFNLTRGQTNTIDVTATERATGNGVSGIDVTLFGNRYNVDTETFDTGYTQTDSEGNGRIDLTVPADVTRDIMINDLTPYSSANRSGGSISPPIDADITVSPENPAPGNSFTVSYSTDLDEPVSAIAAYPSREGANLTLVKEGETGELTVPDRMESGDEEDLELLLISDSGEVAEQRTRVELSGDGSGGGTREVTATRSIESSTVPAGNTTEVSVTIDLTAETSDLQLTEGFDSSLAVSVLDDDGATVSTVSEDELVASWGGVSQVTLTYEVTIPDGASNGQTFELSGTAKDGEVDVQTTVGGDTTIEVGEPDNPIAEYANDQGVVDSNGLLSAAADFRNGEIGASLLLEVASAFRSGEPVV